MILLSIFNYAPRDLIVKTEANGQCVIDVYTFEIIDYIRYR